MNYSSELRSSQEGRSSASLYPHAIPGTAVRETVLNPEGHPVSSSQGSTSSTLANPTPPGPVDPQDASLWRRLFPAEGDPIAIDDVEAAAGCDLGHFSIEERIGSGGMGAVFRALDTRLQRVVALKVLAPVQSRDRSSVQRFQNEARAAARLDHENIARVFYIGEDRGLHFIAFEYITGQNVREIISRTGRLRVADAVNHVLQIAAALRHTAAAGVVHRDIKPSNIIITPNGRAKLVDLGLARKLAADSVGDLTVAGTTLGTFDYISPEQARDPRSVDIRSDIYSLGCTLYHMLTGGPPYSSGTMLQKLLDHQTGHAPDPHAANPTVPPALATICRKMMAGDPRHRYATPDDLIRELAAVATAIGLRPMMTDTYIWARPHPSPVSRFRPGFIWGGSAAIVLLLAFFVDRWPVDRPRDANPVPPIANVSGENLPSSPNRLVPAAASEIVAPSDSSNKVPTDPDEDRPAELAAAPQSNPTTPSPEIPDMEDALPSPLTPEVIPPLVAPDDSPTKLADGSPPSPPPLLERPDSMPEPSTEPTSEQALNEVVATFSALREMFAPLLPLIDSTDSPALSPAVVAERSEDFSGNGTTIPNGMESTVPGILPFAIQTPEGGMSKLREFTSLSEAISQAGPGEIIEIRVNGKLPGGPITEPVRIDDREIFLRPGLDANNEPYKPIVVFASNPADMAPAQMVVLTGNAARLDVEGIRFRMTVNDTSPVSESGALFLVEGAGEVALRDVAITINSERRSCSVFDLRPADDPSAESPSFNDMTSEEDLFQIDITDSFIRGTADLVTVGHTKPGEISIKNTGIAIQQSLLNVTGGIEFASDAVDVTLEHVTAMLGNPLLRIDLAGIRRYVAPIHIVASNNVIATSENSQLIFMNGELDGISFADALNWTGESNIFDGFSEFWSVRRPSGGGAMDFPSSFSNWQEYWPRENKVNERESEPSVSTDGMLVQLWDNPEAKTLEPIEFTPEDLRLNLDAPLIPIQPTAIDRLVGVNPDELPSLLTPTRETLAEDSESVSR